MCCYCGPQLCRWGTDRTLEPSGTLHSTPRTHHSGTNTGRRIIVIRRLAIRTRTPPDQIHTASSFQHPLRMRVNFPLARAPRERVRASIPFPGVQTAPKYITQHVVIACCRRRRHHRRCRQTQPCDAVAPAWPTTTQRWHNMCTQIHIDVVLFYVV